MVVLCHCNGSWGLRYTFGTGYVLSYKRDHGNWQEVQLDADRTSHVLQSLHCGATYHAYLTAHNRVGNSRTSAIVTAITKGGGELALYINLATTRIRVSVLFVCVFIWSYEVILCGYSETLILYS
jgi:hypothetical protein